MAEYISINDAREAVWRILNGMGISQKYNGRLCEEVDAVFDEYVRQDDERVNKIIEEVKGWD